MKLACRDKLLDLSAPVVMGVLNVTPDSFSDGGRYLETHAAFQRAQEMVDAGAAIIDVGGESTRPGAAEVSESEELSRVIPVIKAIAELPAVISVDTSKPAVMRAAVSAGADMINDVRALREQGALDVAAESGAAVCLMHMQRDPRTMQAAPEYADVVSEVHDFLRTRVAVCHAAGIGPERIVVDPGFGFGKTLDHNLQLLTGLRTLTALAPILVGLSRKSMLGAILGGRPVEERLFAGLAAATIAAWQGARIVRTHDVRPTVDAMRIVAAAASRHL